MDTKDLDREEISNVLDEREYLEHIISLGVGYPHRGTEINRHIASTDHLYRKLDAELWSMQSCNTEPRTAPSGYAYFDVLSGFQNARERFFSGEAGYRLIDLNTGCLELGETFRIENAIIDFSLLGSTERIVLRIAGVPQFDAVFLVTPSTVYLTLSSRRRDAQELCVPLGEFHLLSFVKSRQGALLGLVVDHNAAHRRKPEVLFVHERNEDLIQAQIDKEDDRLHAEYEAMRCSFSNKKHRKM